MEATVRPAACMPLTLLAVSVDTDRLTAEMKYWLCGEDGEISDVLLHVMAEQTMKGIQHAIELRPRCHELNKADPD